jgi:5-methylcytosine-specific restriction endonuclease McrA
MTPKQKRTKKAQLIRDYGSLCWWCECCLPPEKLTLDHLKPKSRGGSNSLENLRLACFSCNNSRGNSLYPPQCLSVLKPGFS